MIKNKNKNKKTPNRKSYEGQLLLCTSQWVLLKFVSFLIFSQLDVYFSGPVSSDLTSQSGRPFTGKQAVKVPWESNTVACCHDQRPTGKPDKETVTWKKHDFLLFFFNIVEALILCRQKDHVSLSASIRRKRQKAEQGTEDRDMDSHREPLKKTFGQRLQD